MLLGCLTLCIRVTNLFSFGSLGFSRPEQMGADLNPATLVGFLQQLGGRQGALGPQGVVVLLAEALHLLQGADDQADG